MAASEAGGGGKGERAAGETIRNYKGKMEIIFAHVGVCECVESIRGRKKRGTQQAVEGRGRREEGRENRICLCMYAEVLTLQFGGRGHPVSARLGAIYQRELSRGDTAGALASAALPPCRDQTSVERRTSRGRCHLRLGSSSNPRLPASPPQHRGPGARSDQHFPHFRCKARTAARF